MGYFVYAVPVLVLIIEYIAVSSALAFARYAVELEQPVVSLMGGLVKVGGNLPYDAVPNTVVTLHLLALLMSVIYFVYFVIFSPSKEEPQPIPPQKG